MSLIFISGSFHCKLTFWHCFSFAKSDPPLEDHRSSPTSIARTISASFHALITSFNITLVLALVLILALLILALPIRFIAIQSDMGVPSFFVIWLVFDTVHLHGLVNGVMAVIGWFFDMGSCLWLIPKAGFSSASSLHLVNNQWFTARSAEFGNFFWGTTAQ